MLLRFPAATAAENALRLPVFFAGRVDVAECERVRVDFGATCAGAGSSGDGGSSGTASRARGDSDSARRICAESDVERGGALWRFLLLALLLRLVLPFASVAGAVACRSAGGASALLLPLPSGGRASANVVAVGSGESGSSSSSSTASSVAAAARVLSARSAAARQSVAIARALPRVSVPCDSSSSDRAAISFPSLSFSFPEYISPSFSSESVSRSAPSAARLALVALLLPVERLLMLVACDDVLVVDEIERRFTLSRAAPTPPSASGCCCCACMCGCE